MSRIKFVRPIAIALTVAALGLAGCSSVSSNGSTDYINAAGPSFSPVY